MHRLAISLIGLLSSAFIYGQDLNVSPKFSAEDSVLLSTFWTEFRTAVNAKDKIKLAALCEFPFYCAPCIVDTTPEPKGVPTLKITKALFFKSQFNFFLDEMVRSAINKYNSFEECIFHPYSDNIGGPKGFFFAFTIVPPSEKWEGLQGLLYLDKIKGVFKITGVDTVP
jgi:hypothetical protein